MKSYECKGQLSIFDVELPEEKPICKFSNHTCNKKELFRQAAALAKESGEMPMCPHVCCRMCATKSCAVRCNGSQEPKKIFQWFRLSKHTPPEDPDKVIKVMYTYFNGKHTGECAATYENGKFEFIHLPFDIGKVEPEAWKETEYTREEYRAKNGW